MSVYPRDLITPKRLFKPMGTEILLAGNLKCNLHAHYPKDEKKFPSLVENKGAVSYSHKLTVCAVFDPSYHSNDNKNGSVCKE